MISPSATPPLHKRTRTHGHRHRHTDTLTSGNDLCTSSSNKFGKNPTPNESFAGTRLHIREPQTLQKLLTTCEGLRA